MPFTGEFEFNTAGYETAGGSVGDLAVTLKRVLRESDDSAIVAGLGINVPTGSDARGSFPLAFTTFTVHNQAVHLSPFVGFSARQTDRRFHHGFVQLDIPCNGNRIDVVDTFAPASYSAIVNDQTLLYLDYSAGYWLYRDPYSFGITGLASVLECHYTTALQDADIVAFPAVVAAPTFGNRLNRFDIVNMTVGLHLEIGAYMALRVAGMFPLRTGDNRSFDSEVQATLNWRF